jgi:hypothetical protein
MRNLLDTIAKSRGTMLAVHIVNNNYTFLLTGVNSNDILSLVVSPLERWNLFGINVQNFNLILPSKSLIVFLL